MIPASVYDNFFDDPDAVRAYALSLEYTKHAGGIPGKRTENISDINPELFDMFQMKYIQLIYGAGDYDSGIDARFQLTPSYYEEGWVHADNTGLPNEPTIAGVIYLTPNAPINAGTSVYRKTDATDLVLINNNIKIDFYQDKEVNMSEYRLERDRNNSLFEKTLDVSNVYNRLFTYNTTQLHRENKFFGTTKEDSRLTLVFFGNIERAND
jgi:hypothetical protein